MATGTRPARRVPPAALPDHMTRFQFIISMFVLALVASVASASTSIPVARTAGMKIDHVVGPKAEHPLDRPDGSVVVVIFGSIDCPVANAVVPEIRRIHRQVEAGGGKVLFVHPTPGQAKKKMASHATDRKLEMSVLHDPRHELVGLLGAKVTPEAFVLLRKGEEWRVVYRGPVDNLYADVGRRRRNATKFHVREAVTAAFAGLPVEQSVRRPIGCFIERGAGK